MVYEFIDNGSSFTIKFNNKQYTAGKADVELIIQNTELDNELTIISNTAKFTQIKVLFPTDTIIGIGSGSTTATELHNALNAIFFLDESELRTIRLSNIPKYELTGVLTLAINHDLNRFVRVILIDENGDDFTANINRVNDNKVIISGIPPMYGYAYVF